MKGDQCCKNCRFSKPRRNSFGEGDYLCLRRPPVRFSIDEPSGFPDVYDSNWCGEWEADIPASHDLMCLAMAKQVLAGDFAAARALADRLMELPVIPTGG